MSLLQLPPLQSIKLTNPFRNGSSALRKTPSLSSPPSSSLSSVLPPIRAMRSMQGKVVSTVNDKTVAVEVVRLSPHPKYKRRVRMKKKYQAHDPENQFKVGDIVQLEKSRPISKTKTFVAVAVSNVQSRKSDKVVDVDGDDDKLGIPFESEQQQEEEQEEAQPVG